MNDYSFPNLQLPNISIPELPVIDTPMKHMWADEQFDILKKYIQQFERTVDDEHAVAIMMTNFGQSVLMQVTNITYEYPVLMVFKGFVNGRIATLIQHVNQLNFLLTTIDQDPEKTKYPIGFEVKSQT